MMGRICVAISPFNGAVRADKVTIVFIYNPPISYRYTHYGLKHPVRQQNASSTARLPAYGAPILVVVALLKKITGSWI